MKERFKRLFTAASIVYINQILIIIATIGVNLKVIAHLGAHRFGIYSTVLAYTSFFTVLTFSSGVDELVVKDLSGGTSNRKTVNEYITTALLLRLALGATAFCILSVGVFLLEYEGVVRDLILIFSLSMLFSFNRRNSLFLIIPTVHERRLLPEVITFVITCGVLAAKIVLVAADASLTYFVVSDLLLAGGLSSAFLFFALRRQHFSIRLSLFNLSLAKSFLSRSITTALGALFVMLSMRIDQVMLSKMKGMESVGYYSVAVQLVEGFSFIPVIASSLLLPIFSRNRHRQALMSDMLSITFRTAAWISLSIVMTYWVTGEYILRFIWGEKYLASLSPLKILAWSEVFVFIGTIYWAACISYGLHNYYLAINVVLAALNIGLNLALIPEYGATGAAISTLISYGFGFAMMWLFAPLRGLARIIWNQTLPIATAVAIPALGFFDSLTHPILVWAAIFTLMTMAVLFANVRQACQMTTRPVN